MPAAAPEYLVTNAACLPAFCAGGRLLVGHPRPGGEAGCLLPAVAAKGRSAALEYRPLALLCACMAPQLCAHLACCHGACPSAPQAVGLAWDVRLPTEAQKRKLLKSASGKPSAVVAPGETGAPAQGAARPDVAMAH